MIKRIQFLLNDKSNSVGWVLYWGRSEIMGLPTMEETISYYERCAGKEVENFFYYQVFTALKMGIVAIQLAKVTDDLKIPGFLPDFARNNWGTRKLEELLSAKSSL